MKAKAMNKHHFDNWLAATLGVVGGGIKFTMLQLNPFTHLEFWDKAIPSIVTAALCALAGLAMKDVYKGIKSWWKERKNK